jgi:Fe2+ transport system protein FeoA
MILLQGFYQVRLDDLPLNTPALIEQIDRRALGESAARRLEAFGFTPGTRVEAIHAGIANRRLPLVSPPYERKPADRAGRQS